MIGSANDRKTYQFDLSGAYMPPIDSNLAGSDGVTNGFAIKKPALIRKSQRGLYKPALLQEAAKRRAIIIKRMSEGMFEQKVQKNVDFITDFNASQQLKKKNDAHRMNPYYKLAYSRKINPSRAFMSKQVIY